MIAKGNLKMSLFLIFTNRPWEETICMLVTTDVRSQKQHRIMSLSVNFSVDNTMKHSQSRELPFTFKRWPF